MRGLPGSNKRKADEAIPATPPPAKRVTVTRSASSVSNYSSSERFSSPKLLLAGGKALFSAARSSGGSTPLKMMMKTGKALVRNGSRRKAMHLKASSDADSTASATTAIAAPPTPQSKKHAHRMEKWDQMSAQKRTRGGHGCNHVELDFAKLGLSKEDTIRQHILHEIMESERGYVDILHEAKHVFTQALTTFNICSKDQLHLIFNNWDEILALHKELLAALSAAEDKETNVIKAAGPAFKAFTSGASVYTTYVPGILNAKEFAKGLQSNAYFERINAVAQGMDALKRQDFKDCLDWPRSHVQKLPLLLERLIKVTVNGDEDREALEEALEMLRETLRQVDVLMGEQENKHRIMALKKGLHFVKESYALNLDPERDVIEKEQIVENDGHNLTCLLVRCDNHPYLVLAKARSSRSSKSDELVLIGYKPMSVEKLTVFAGFDDNIRHGRSLSQSSYKPPSNSPISKLRANDRTFCVRSNDVECKPGAFNLRTATSADRDEWISKINEIRSTFDVAPKTLAAERQPLCPIHETRM